MILVGLVCTLLTVLLILWKQLHKVYMFFDERNVKYLKPTFLIGNSWEAIVGRKNPAEVIEKLYQSFPEEDIVGHYELVVPNFVIRNPDIVDKILTSDFSHFHDRVKGNDELESPSDANLFILPGNKWRAIRYKFTPLFTSGKLKYMYQSMASCGDNLVAVLDKYDGMEVEMSEIMGLFAMDVIGSCAFGIEPNVLQNPKSKFREMGKQVFENRLITTIMSLIFFLAPKLAKILKIKGFIRSSVLKYFWGIVRNTIEVRKKTGRERNDFVQMLIQLKEKGKIEVPIHDKGDDYLMMNKPSEIYEVHLTDNILIGGASTFLLAGFHASAMTLTYALFELARKPEVIERVRKEMEKTVEGDLTYEHVKNLQFLEKVVKETLRMHPTATVLSRVCTKEYTFPNGVKILPGEAVTIPALAIQYDPLYWNDPYDFIPDRFDTTPRPGTWLAFGDGPRICIAMRFAMMEMKFALAKMIMRYNFALSETTQIPLKLTPRMFLATPLGGVTLNITKR